MYFQNRSLFIDEACLSSQLIERSYSGLFDNLEYQYAPPLFAVLVKFVTSIFGSTEYALRLVPLLASLLCLPLFYKLCRQFLKPEHCIFPLFLFAFGMPVLQYATEVKQYSTDMLLTIALLLLSFRWEISSFNRSKILLWSLIGSLVVWFSMPGVFILFGIGVYYLFEFYKNKKWKQSLYILLPICIWLISFGLYYFSIIRYDIGLENLEDYHARFFLPLIPLTWADWQKVGSILITFFRTGIGSTVLAIGFGILTFIMGIWQLKKSRFSTILLFLLPLLACLFASGLKLYSLIPRLTLFYLPVLLLIVAIGSAFLIEHLKKMPYLIYIAIIIIMINQKGYSYFYNKFEIEELRPVLEYVQLHREPEDAAYLYFHATHAYVFYSTYHEKAETLAIPGIQIGAYEDRPETLKLPDNKRVWLIFSHIEPAEFERFTEVFSKKGNLKDQLIVKRGGALLLEKSGE